MIVVDGLKFGIVAWAETLLSFERSGLFPALAQLQFGGTCLNDSSARTKYAPVWQSLWEEEIEVRCPRLPGECVHFLLAEYLVAWSEE
jgi:hypothetical protein